MAIPPEIDEPKPSPAPSSTQKSTPVASRLPSLGWKFWRGQPETILARATVLLAVATLVLAFIAGIQAWILATTDVSAREAARAAVKSASTNEESLKTARQNFRAEQRPIIWFTKLGVPQFALNRQPADDTKGQIYWMWHYTNYGKTPALHVVLQDRFLIIDNKHQPSFDDPVLSTGEAPLPPGKEDFNSAVSSPGISPDTFNQLMAKDDGIGVAGTIVYYDVYGEKYESIFCFSHLAGGAIVYCHGNDIK
jgi:hypothetical protein